MSRAAATSGPTPNAARSGGGAAPLTSWARSCSRSVISSIRSSQRRATAERRRGRGQGLTTVVARAIAGCALDELAEAQAAEVLAERRGRGVEQSPELAGSLGVRPLGGALGDAEGAEDVIRRTDPPPTL